MRWLGKTSMFKTPVRMKHHVTSELWLQSSFRRTFTISSTHNDETVESLKRALVAQILHTDYLSSHLGNICNLYVPRDSEDEDFARFVLSKFQTVAVVFGRKGCGKTAFILEKLRGSQGLMNYMKAQRLRQVSCDGFVISAETLTASCRLHVDDIEGNLSAAIARHIRDRFVQHFSRHTNDGDAHLLIAAAALQCMRSGLLKSQFFRGVPAATTAVEPLTRIKAIASRLQDLGLNDLDAAFHYLGVEHPDHNFWCALYAVWFRNEQPLLVFDEVERVPPQTRVQLIEAIVKLTAMLTTPSGEHRRRWKILIALRSETTKEARDVLWKNPTLILLGESTARLPDNVRPLGNPLTPDCMFQIVDQRMRAIAELYRNSLPAYSDLVRSAERLREIFRDQWNMYVGGSRRERASLARHCASANIRSALTIASASCLTVLYEERRAVRSRLRD